MATVGTFTHSGDSFTGMVTTLSINVNITIKPASKTSDKAPDYCVSSNSVEFGAAWKRSAVNAASISRSSSTTLSFLAPIHASLIETDEAGSCSLIWSHRNNE